MRSIIACCRLHRTHARQRAELQRVFRIHTRSRWPASYNSAPQQQWKRIDLAPSGARFSGAARPCSLLYAELLEVVVDVFVHPHGPFVGGEVAEEGMGMKGAAYGTGGGEAVEKRAEDLPSAVQIPVVRDLETGDRGRVPPHGLALLKGFLLDGAANEAADEHSGRPTIAERQLHAYRAVRHRLAGGHLAPEARGVGAQFGETIFEFLNAFGLPEIFHGGVSLGPMIADRLRRSQDGKFVLPAPLRQRSP
jgi:hypothetical protein